MEGGKGVRNVEKREGKRREEMGGRRGTGKSERGGVKKELEK